MYVDLANYIDPVVLAISSISIVLPVRSSYCTAVQLYSCMYTVARSLKGPSHCIHDVRRAARRSLWLARSVKVLPHCMHDVRRAARRRSLLLAECCGCVLN
eukprot:COSAG01_NODE_17_length_39991_cov_30.596160_13_plen_101_part_00